MLRRPLLPVILIALPIAGLLSIGCGILAFPFEVPQIIATNAQSIKFTVDIVDQHQKPLDGVTVKVRRCAIAPDVIFVDTGDIKDDPPKVVDKTLAYSTFGNYAVIVEYSKPGYESVTHCYANKDDVPIVTGGWMQMPIRCTHINVKTYPRSFATLVPAPPTPPRNSP